MTVPLKINNLARVVLSQNVRSGIGVALTLLPIAGCGRVTMHRSQLYLSYPALGARGPSGITVVSLAVARRIRTTPSGPVWIAEVAHQSHGALPEIATAREVGHRGQRRVWISRSDRDGVCALIFAPDLAPDPHHAHSVSASCGARREVSRGLAIVWSLRRGNTVRSFVFGVVPLGVAAVSLTLAVGRPLIVTVTHNFYSAEVAAGISRISPLPGSPAKTAP